MKKSKTLHIDTSIKMKAISASAKHGVDTGNPYNSISFAKGIKWAIKNIVNKSPKK